MSIRNNKNIEDIYPLSPTQEGMLFHSLFAPASGVYVGQKSYKLQGNLDIDAFKQAWQQVMDRHPILRTAFVWGNREKPIQIVGRWVKLPLEQQDWRGLHPSQQAKQLETFLQADRRRDFEFSKAPLMRLTLIQLFEDTYQLIWSHHHLLLDGWSLPLLFQEVLAFYEAFRLGQNLHLERPRPYRDYIAWLQQQDIARAKEFWQQQLSGFSRPTPLGVDRPTQRSVNQAANQEDNYAKQQLQLSATATAQLQSLVRQHRLTLSTLIQGVWALLLSRYSAEQDVVFGVTSSGRPTDLVGCESIVGNFINTLPMRVKVTPNEPLLSWLQQLQKQQIDSRQYEYSPLVEIQGWSEVPRSISLFESIIVSENYLVTPAQQKWSDNLKISQVHSILETHYPLTLLVGMYPEFAIDIVYDSHRFEATTITRMLGHMRTLLEGIVANPDRCLSSLPILTEAERHQQLIEWNETQVECPQKKCIHQLFEEQVERTPDAVAVVFEDQQLTYDELNRKANQLAHYLQQLGVEPEVLVGICMERSLNMLVGLLGILKAGGAYVPLDPAYPKERLAFILQDAGVSVLLTQQNLAAQLPEHRARVICLDARWEEIARQSECTTRTLRDRNPTHETTPENLAYAIYTSGSTGQPKGVQIPHSALVNFLSAMRQTPGLSEKDILLSVTTLSFDIAALELYLPLIVGARLVIVSREVAADGTQLLQQLTSCGATVMQATPATWRLLLAAGWQNHRPLKILCGGEALDYSLADRLLERGTELWNLYGPTETTIWSAIHKVEPQNSAESQNGLVSIGRPIANTQFYILDPYMQPVPVGVSGELHIGGVGLARGYLNRPELTAQKFIPNPFSIQEKAENRRQKAEGSVQHPTSNIQHPKLSRLYKTGDLARYLPDGNIEFLGRIDHQVKVRGFRIELGEIEAVLSQYPRVREAVVAAREDEQGSQRLVAYTVFEPEQTPTITELRRFLEKKLPSYMVPSAFVPLDALPLTPNGKVDRKALPAPEVLRPELDVTYVMPQTEAEQAIAKVWQNTLKIEKIGIHDNFFELGGHSLLLVQVNSQLRELFNTDLSLIELFRYPTISALAEYFSQTRHQQSSLLEEDIQTEKVKVAKIQQQKRRQKMQFQ
jgi:amino acid adenylation domain-containing protein